MKSSLPFLSSTVFPTLSTLFFLVFLFNYSYATITPVNSNQLSNKTTILAGDNFLYLFVWKDLQIHSLDDLFSGNASSKPLKFFSFDTDNISTINMRKMIGMINTKQFNSIPERWNFYQIQFGRNSECIFGSVFENFDIMIGRSSEFSDRIRLNRNHRRNRKKEGDDWLNSNDFVAIPLFPTRFYIESDGNEVDSSQITQELFETLLNVTNTTQLTCKQSVEHDSSLFERLHGSLYMTNQQFDWSAKYFNISSDYSYNMTFISQATIRYESAGGQPLFLTNSIIDSQLWSSLCFKCDSFSCVSERWGWQDTLDIIVVSFGFVFYAILFISGSFKSPVVYRKYGIIFVATFFNMCEFSSTLNAFNNTCVTLGVVFANFSACMMAFIYIFTVLRYFYLRNLYHFVKNSKHPKFLKYLASESLGFVFTIVLPIPVSALFLIPIWILIPSYSLPTINTTNNLIVIFICALSCIAGIIFLLFDAFKNRNIISKYGFRRFFIFEDPYYFRIDLLSLVVILIILIAGAIVFASAPTYVPALRFCIGLAIYMIGGGTSMIFLLLERLKSLSKKKIQSYEKMDKYDIYIEMIKKNTNEDLIQLFRTYCSKSLALENYMFIEMVMESKRKSENISIENLQRIHKQFLIPYSAYEVNIPSGARERYVDNFEKVTKNNETKTNIQILDEIMLEVEANLKSTFNRFERTSEFLEWREIYALQKEKSAIKTFPIEL
ncbi:predicted protein [Naegleria gruberi]|uniref:Predicted protein n=1 Tax=Naegleria gruberi TaxID=5762 RepID=D2W3U7_NAEGR|nr:uncharacterized protein NAEGRDRAFT_54490 [Naegleria gruberi]EFC36234.1 predicted protein [Naegleria gruberi]|eukprot:XP_002668978.1 predicted protein [Naegleria gruberi strain NEG-M]